jgi:hypothetical protein
LPQARIIELADSGWCVIADAQALTESAVLALAQSSAYGLVEVDS